MKKIIKKFKKLFVKHDSRKCSLNWWNSLSYYEKLDIAKEYFDEFEKGETTDIDIEAMYYLYAKE